MFGVRNTNTRKDFREEERKNCKSWNLDQCVATRALCSPLVVRMKTEMIEGEESQTIWKVLQKKLQWLMLTELIFEVDLELWIWLCAL